MIDTTTAGVSTVGTYGAFARSAGAIATRREAATLISSARSHRRQIFRFTARFFEFDRIWERPGRDQVDVAATSIAPLASRTSPGVVWSDPYFTVRRSLLIRSADRHELQTRTDFSGRAIGVTKGSTADMDTNTRRPPTARVVHLDDQDRAVDALLRGEIDGFGAGDVCSEYLADSHPGLLAVSDVHQMESPETFAFAVRVASGLLDPLNEFIRAHRGRY